MNNDMFMENAVGYSLSVSAFAIQSDLYIANIDDDLRKQMNIPEKFHAVGPYRFPYRCGSTNSSR